jgi:hypothetical protein
LQIQKEKFGLHVQQERLMAALESIKTTLEETWILGGDSDECSMWDWLENEVDASEWSNVIFEDFPNNSSANSAMDAITTTVELL